MYSSFFYVVVGSTYNKAMTSSLHMITLQSIYTTITILSTNNSTSSCRAARYYKNAARNTTQTCFGLYQWTQCLISKIMDIM